MGNGIKNAGLLDGVTDWSATAGAVRTVDDEVIGGPGRNVLTVTKTLTTGQSISAWSTGLAVTAGQVLEVFALSGNSEAGLTDLTLQVLDGGGTVIGSTPIALRRRGAGVPRRGLSVSFNDHFGKVAAPATGTARLLATSVAAANAPHQLYLTKPYLAPARAGLARWDPGAHSNPDLDLPIWPADLPPFRSVSPEPYANRKSFAGDVGIPGNTKLYGGPLHHAMRGQMRLTLETADVLDAFFESDAEPFYIVRPDTEQLCMAEWLDTGAPKPAEQRGRFTFVEVGLHIWAP